MRRHWVIVGFSGGIAAAIYAGCSAEGDSGNTTEAGPTASSSSGATTASGGAGGQGGDIVGSGGDTMGCQAGKPDVDDDKDGFTEVDGDCNDCDEFVNPGAVEVVAEPDEDGGVPRPADEDCDKEIDNVDPPCDTGLAFDSMDPMDAAKAIGLCKFVKTAKWVLADGSPPPLATTPSVPKPGCTAPPGNTQEQNFHLGHGILDNMGANNAPQEGEQLLALSSGTARREDQPGFIHRNFDKGYLSNSPLGFPKESMSCPNVTTKGPHDATGLELEVTAPSNAQGISFDFNFLTYEWPKFICTDFNDFFVANLTPFPVGQPDGNVSFDGDMNPISVNNAFLGACGCPGGGPCVAPPNSPSGKSFSCALGKTPLTGTDFDADEGNPGWTNGATGWLRTTAPVEPGKVFKIRFVTYDSSDGCVDSTTLIDNWKWSAKPGTVETIIPPK